MTSPRSGLTVGASVRPMLTDYVPAIDGLRALAVTAVVLYHSDFVTISGGFLGVEVFFVVSGYLITSLLLAERRQSGTINLKAFWMRRARRLLPALFFTLVAVLAFTAVFYPEEVAALRGDALAALGYSTNWYLILDNQAYFEAFERPSLFRHLWSLAVEEQFYIAFPLLLAGVLRLMRPRLVAPVVLLGAVASATAMALLYGSGADASRIYYGTDTRLSGLLLGAALAFVLAPGKSAAPRGLLRTTLVELLGAAALAGLVALHFLLAASDPLLYRGGIALVAAATAILIFVVVRWQTRLGALLGVAPLAWLGTRSYSIYLWHWPVFMLTRPHIDLDWDPVPLLALRLGVTLVLAEASYRLVENPARHGAIGRAWNDAVGAFHRRRVLPIFRYSGASVLAGALVIPLSISLIGAQPEGPPGYLAVEHVRIGNWVPREPAARPALSRSPPATMSVTPTPSPAPQQEGLSVSYVPPRQTVPSLPRPPAPPPPPPPPPVYISDADVTAIGDSVMLGAVPQLSATIASISIDAQIGRQFYTSAETLRGWRDAGLLGDVVVVHLGNNGFFKSDHFDQMMSVLADVRLVVFVNLTVSQEWEGNNNAVLVGGVSRYANAVLADWHSASAGRPDLFYSDHTHVRPPGAQLYANLVASVIAAHPPPTPTPEPTPPLTPTPAPTPAPTTPAVSPSPVPTASPAPTPTPTPSETPTP